MMNPDVIRERLLEMDENLNILNDLRKTAKEDFQRDPKIFKLAERCLEISIQAILDVCHHIIANNNWPRPKDNQEAVKIIAMNNIIPENFANRILPLAGLRNILVHEYLKVDARRIYNYLQDLKDFREFERYILKYLESK